MKLREGKKENEIERGKEREDEIKRENEIERGKERGWNKERKRKKMK